jgi:hypothetical protein
MSTPERWEWPRTDDESHEDLSRALDAYRNEGPGAGQRERVWNGVAGELAAPVTAKGKSTSVVPGARAKLWLVLGGVAVVAAIIVALRYPRTAPVAQEPRSRAVAVVRPQAPVPSIELSLPSAPSAEIPVAQPPVRAPRVARRATIEKTASVVQATPADSAAELTLLTKARRSLVSSPELALRLLDEHERDHPRSSFVEEREVLAIEALLRVGRAEEARGRGERFLREHPRSAHGAHVREVLTGR